MSERDPDERFPVTQPPAAPRRELDVVLHGATGYVGRLTAEHLARGAPAGLRIALSGRSRARLEQLRDDLGERASAWTVLVTDSADGAALAALARRTRVVASTVGPYARHGEPLVAACADAGTHYVDLTGEVLFVRSTIDAHHARAQATGARIVHACGFDSVPSDLAVLLLHQQVTADGAGVLGDTTLVVRMRGGLSGGTVASMLGQLDAVHTDPQARRVVLDPYALSPDRDQEPVLPDERDAVPPFAAEPLGGWVGPFVMAPFNTRVVRRSNALLGWSYGRSFRYREVMGFGRGRQAQARAWAVAGGLAAVLGAAGWGPSRAALQRVVPQPGSGPSPEQRAKGSFEVRVLTRTSTGVEYVARVAADRDPGYDATAVMLGESAVALALGQHLPDRAGVLTPATGIGTALVHRLRDNGFELSVGRR